MGIGYGMYGNILVLFNGDFFIKMNRFIWNDVGVICVLGLMFNEENIGLLLVKV